MVAPRGFAEPVQLLARHEVADGDVVLAVVEEGYELLRSVSQRALDHEEDAVFPGARDSVVHKGVVDAHVVGRGRGEGS